jgi:cell division protein FtsB
VADTRRRRRRIVRGALLAVALVGLLFAFVYPTRTYLDQRRETRDAEAQLELLRSQRAQLQTQAKDLSKDSEVIRIAREHYGLVQPGQIPFVILPTPTTTTTPAKPGTTVP